MKKETVPLEADVRIKRTSLKKSRHKTGFTLMETIIYIALFSLIMTGGFVTAYELLQGNDALTARTTTGEEGEFVIKKIEWALTGISNDPADIASPLAAATSSTLSIKKWMNGSLLPVTISYDPSAQAILMQSGTGPLLPITTANVKVTNLEFDSITPQGSAPAGISAHATINGTDFSITSYIRK